MGYVIEKEFEYKGLWCVVAMMDLGHRCGYVGVPKGHKYYGKNYSEIEGNIDCHGGLTFSSREKNEKYPSKEHTDLWWFGWDYGHCWDANDWEAFEKNFDSETVEIRKRYCSFNSEGTIAYIEDVEQCCKNVVDQFLDDTECINDGE